MPLSDAAVPGVSESSVTELGSGIKRLQNCKMLVL